MSEIKTFVQRKQNRMTDAQARALKSSDLQYLRSSVDDIICAKMPVILDIGFGMGDSLLSLAERYQDHLVVGIDVFQPGIAKSLILADTNSFSNLKIIDGDAVCLLNQIPDASLAGVQLLFPDPWPKKRHHKRRFIQIERLLVIYRKLAPGGWLRVVSDCSSYIEHTMSCLWSTKFNEAPDLFGSGVYTKYWERAIALGNKVTIISRLKIKS